MTQAAPSDQEAAWAAARKRRDRRRHRARELSRVLSRWRGLRRAAFRLRERRFQKHDIPLSCFCDILIAERGGAV